MNARPGDLLPDSAPMPMSLPQDTLRRVVHVARPIVDRIARLGFAAKGLVAVMIGALALRLALGRYGGDIAGPEDVLREFLRQPFGRFNLGVIALGLWAHACWKMVQAILDPERKGTGFTAVMERTSFGITALGYVALGMAALQLLLGRRVAGITGGPDELAARVLAPHLGRWVTGLIGSIFVLAGLLQLRLASIAGFRHILCLDRMSAVERNAVVLLGRAGYAALGIVSAVIGYFLIRVALLYNPELAGGWREALGFLASLEYGRWVLGLVAAGLLCYGLFHILLVRYHEEIDRLVGLAARNRGCEIGARGPSRREMNHDD